MPELPEVETVKNTLANLVIGKTIKRIDIFRAKNIHVSEEEFRSTLVGKTITGFSRYGKYIVFRFDETCPKVMVSHLRMEGKYFLRNESEPYQKHDIFSFVFMDGTYLAYNDTRKFGTIDLSDKDNLLNEAPLNTIGPDPFMMEDASKLVECFKGKNIPIKSMLLDQTIMSGLGNIYVDEVLFASKVHPETPARLLNKKQIDTIFDESKKTLLLAIEQGGSTIKSYHPQEGVSGNFQVNLKVYGKKDGICPNCGYHFRKIKVGGRGTTFCPVCQKNPIGSPVFGITGPIGSGKSTVRKYLESKGFLTISADQIVHDLYKDEKVISKMKKIVPSLKVVDGEIDRVSLREVLLNEPKTKAKVEEYIHSLVRQVIEEFIYKNRVNKKLAIEVPLLFESGLDELCDEIIFIDVDLNKQTKYLHGREKVPSDMKKLNSSFRYSENKKKSTYLVSNNSTLDKLYASIDKIIS